MKLKKLIAVVGGILLLMGIMAGSAFTDVFIKYGAIIREVPVSETTLMLLLGSGLIGVGMITRKMFRK